MRVSPARTVVLRPRLQRLSALRSRGKRDSDRRNSTEFLLGVAHLLQLSQAQNAILAIPSGRAEFSGAKGSKGAIGGRSF
jgi:hypothetical protein